MKQSSPHSVLNPSSLEPCQNLRGFSRLLRLSLHALLLLGTALYGGDWPMLQGGPSHPGAVSTRSPVALRQLWQRRLSEKQLTSPIISANRLFLGSESGEIWAVDPSNGETIWSRKGAPVAAVPASDGARLFIGDRQGLLIALNAADGSESWRFQANGSIVGSLSFFKEVLLFGSLDHYLYALDSKSGALLWKFKSKAELLGAPTLTEQGWFFTDFKGYAYLLSEDGEKKRRLSLRKLTGLAASSFGNAIYLGTLDGNFMRLELPDLKQKWNIHIKGKEYAFAAPSAMAGGFLLVAGRDRYLRRIEMNHGQQSWIYSANSRFEAAPMILGDKVFFATLNGTIGLLAFETGSLIWEARLTESIKTPAAFSDGRIYLAGDRGSVFCWTSD